MRESEPIDDVIDWLRAEGFSCLGTQHVSWNQSGTKGIAFDQVTIRERYVLECDGDCASVHYIPYAEATMFHFGATQPVPVLEMKSTFFGGSRIQWNFTRPSGNNPTPNIYIHRWTSGKLLSGENCKAPKANNK